MHVHLFFIRARCGPPILPIQETPADSANKPNLYGVKDRRYSLNAVFQTSIERQRPTEIRLNQAHGSPCEPASEHPLEVVCRRAHENARESPQ
jgi:hypothetical protein